MRETVRNMRESTRNMKETDIDKMLKIQTTGRDDYKADEHHHPYEPTPYAVLDRLIESEYITKDDVVIDYGCGKGRVDFYLASKIGCKAIGIEYDERIFAYAEKNLATFMSKNKPGFKCISAEDYKVVDGDCFYFFNPFTVEILQSVLSRILTSYYENPRQIFLFFYYPHEDFVAYLMTKMELAFVDEIDCQDLFDGRDDRERILIFEVTG